MSQQERFRFGLRDMGCNDNKSENFFKQVLEFCKPILKQDNFLDVVAEKFKGFNVNTGGGCMVAYLPFDDTHYIGVSDECIVLYKKCTEEDVTDAEGMMTDSFEGSGDNEDDAVWFSRDVA